ncbi:MAG: 2-dehydro-3-deoxygalactonokinase [Scandinavium sp.]|uniref:2-dehydro-3-deoxygalactonokinase n=1 Tax=Scandinavium sp. TaxID=2830653 RepID=UPI003F317426
MENWIAVDWGSTHLRAWHWQNEVCVNQLQIAAGVSQLNGRTPEEIFRQHIAPWREENSIPVFMAGMIGSDAGWQVAPYLPCPVTTRQLGSKLTEVAGQVWIVPGLKVQQNGECNVMRGEETQLTGAMALSPADVYVMPGTHSKWVSVDGECIQHFSTVMTGELFHLLLNQSLIGKGLPQQQADDEAFQRGLKRGLTTSSPVASLFSARAARVLGELAPTSVADYLSGLLIGAEVAEMYPQHTQPRVTLVGGSLLNARYLRAFAALGVQANCCDGDDAFLQGIRSIFHGRH